MIKFYQVDSLLHALEFASVKHRDQRRKNLRRAPYINHPIQVARLIWDVGGVHDLDPVIAAILHDTVEDTDTTLEEIATEFGNTITAIIDEVSDDKSLPKDVRKRLQIENAHSKYYNARLVILADKISNVSSLVTDPPVNWTRERCREYVVWASQVVNEIRGTHDALETRFDESVRLVLMELDKRD